MQVSSSASKSQMQQNQDRSQYQNFEMRESLPSSGTSTKRKIDFALIRIENDVKEYHKNKLPAKNCLTLISEFQAGRDYSDKNLFYFSRLKNDANQAKNQNSNLNSFSHMYKQAYQTSTNSMFQAKNCYSQNQIQISEFLPTQMQSQDRQADPLMRQSLSLGSIEVQIKATSGLYSSSIFRFIIFFLEKYPHVAPKVFLSDYVSLSGNIMQQSHFPFVNKYTDEVELRILQQDWNPVLSMQMIILALELCVGDDGQDANQSCSFISQRNSVDMHNIAYDYHLSMRSQAPVSLQSLPSNQNQQQKQQVTNSRKRKYLDFSTNFQSTETSPFESDQEGNMNPLKRLKRNMDMLRIHSPIASSNGNQTDSRNQLMVDLNQNRSNASQWTGQNLMNQFGRDQQNLFCDNNQNGQNDGSTMSNGTIGSHLSTTDIDMDN
eukprot:403359594